MKKFVLFISLIALVIGLAGCEELPENKATPPKGPSSGYPAPNSPIPAGYPAGGAATQSAPDGYPGQAKGPIFQIIKPDNTGYVLTLDVFNQLTKVKVTVDGKSEEGVKLGDILAKAGIINYKKVIAAGTNGRLELTKAQVDDQVIIKIAGGATILSPALSKDKWINQINLLKVE